MHEHEQKRKRKKQRYFAHKNGPSCAQPLSSAELWARQAAASREKVRFEVRRVRNKPEMAKQAPNRQEWPGVVRLCAIAACQGQKLRLGGDSLGADPTYLLYLPSRSREVL